MVRATFAVLAVLCFCGAAAGQAVNPPPHPLHKADGHWTPYQPPTEFAPDANVYVIQKGDTLWALAKRFLGNPYLWPQLWEKNRYIRDAHWIYPGDPLVVGVKAAEVEAPAAPAAPAAQPSAAAPPPAAAAGAGGTGAEAPPAHRGGGGRVGYIYCFAYLEGGDVHPQLTIRSAEQIEYKDNYSTDDIVYLSGGEQEGVKAGQEYFIVMPVRKLHHPATNAVLGTVMRYLGRARVLCTQDHTATAEILASCDAIQVGAWLKPFEPIPIPMTVLTPPVDRCDPASTRPRGYIVYSRDDDVSFGADEVVMIDLGEADQLAPGSQAIVYRDNPVPGTPRLLLGELAVLTTGPHWASAKIIRSSGQMHVGDRVELK